jgi:hypothetical protein
MIKLDDHAHFFYFLVVRAADSSAGTASIHLDVYPSTLSLLRWRYCAI